MDKKKRLGVQAVATLLQNANWRGFFTGKLYQGPAKNVCVPGLNCYSCPGAVGACPIGSLQNALSARRFRFPYYVVGLLLFFGALLGRAVCGFLCPFGFLQELLHLLPFPKKLRRLPGERWLRRVKYVILITLVIVLPLCVQLTPFFCKYLCPSGTLAGLLLALSNRGLFAIAGSRFAWKVCVLGLIVLASVVLFRPFCKYLCPLGAFYGLLNPIAAVRMKVDTEKCTGCGKCAAACAMCVDPSKTPNSPECIRCGECCTVCPVDALQLSVKKKATPKKQRVKNRHGH